MEVGLMVTKRDDDDQQPTTDKVNIEQSASGRLEGRVLQYPLKVNPRHVITDDLTEAQCL